MHKHRVCLPKQKLAMGARLFACLKDPQQPPLCLFQHRSLVKTRAGCLLLLGPWPAYLHVWPRAFEHTLAILLSVHAASVAVKTGSAPVLFMVVFSPACYTTAFRLLPTPPQIPMDPKSSKPAKLTQTNTNTRPHNPQPSPPSTMKTSFALAALLPCAAAFVAPAAFPSVASSSGTAAARGRSVMMVERSKSLPFLMKPKNLDGSMAGDVGFDPLGLSEINDVGVDLYWLREAELKHCRLGMMAAAGILFVEIMGPAPGFPAGKSQMDVFWKVYAEKPSLIGAAVAAIAILEVISGVAITQGRENGDRAPGDYNFDPLGFGKDPAKLKDLQVGREGGREGGLGGCTRCLNGKRGGK